MAKKKPSTQIKKRLTWKSLIQHIKGIE